MQWNKTSCVHLLHFDKCTCLYNPNRCQDKKPFPFLQEVSSCLYMHAKLLQSCPTLCDPMDCSLPGSSVHGVLQARILEWVIIPFSRGSSRPRDQTCVSCISCIGRWILYHCATWEAPILHLILAKSQKTSLRYVWMRIPSSWRRLLVELVVTHSLQVPCLVLGKEHPSFSLSEIGTPSPCYRWENWS